MDEVVVTLVNSKGEILKCLNCQAEYDNHIVGFCREPFETLWSDPRLQDINEMVDKEDIWEPDAGESA